MNIIISEEQFGKIGTVINKKPIYTAIFVNKQELMHKYPPKHKNIFYHHSTIEFNPADISNLEVGKKVDLQIIGRLTTEKVDVLLVNNSLSKNQDPHITLSTAEGVKPYESNSEIINNKNKIIRISDTTPGTVGYFNGYDITSNNAISEDIKLDVEIGDTILMGKFKNKKTVIKTIDTDEHGMPTINGKKAATFRIPKKEDLSEATSSDVDLSSFEIKKTMNDKFWVNDDKVNQKVRTRLLKIADDFLEFINVDEKYCKDVQFLGSLANYNWSKYSDIDLHILIDFEKINKDVDFVKEYFDSKRKNWTSDHESLKIYGFPIEIYVQDLKETNQSSNVYSLEKNKWIKKTGTGEKEELNVNKIKQQTADYMTKIDDFKSKYDKKTSTSDLEDLSKKVKSLFDKIKRTRQSGLDSKDSEYSVGNIVFKALRRSGYIETIVDLKRNTYDKLNTIK